MDTLTSLLKDQNEVTLSVKEVWIRI